MGSAVGPSQAKPERLRVRGERIAPPLDYARGLEARHGRDEVAAREVVGRREGLTAGAVRVLLGHRRAAPGAAGDDAPEGSRLAAELACDEGAVVHAADRSGRGRVEGVRRL